ncbi:zinc finger protein 28 isoform X2 [Orussus abietinus]|uniref:zinc finger protein 28 isoform X2 n=1 Tax=Orussus abietinus TaxID=222816 RepID=UPI0006253871|nr:zinc finger protein 28 isoform X2 [Orussus abietinus]
MCEMTTKHQNCRLCLKAFSNEYLTEIFSKSCATDVQLSSKIMVQEDDEFPKYVCKVCEDNVNQFYMFRKTCYQAYFSLLQNYTCFDLERLKCKNIATLRCDDEIVHKHENIPNETKNVETGSEMNKTKKYHNKTNKRKIYPYESKFKMRINKKEKCKGGTLNSATPLETQLLLKNSIQDKTISINNEYSLSNEAIKSESHNDVTVLNASDVRLILKAPLNESKSLMQSKSPEKKWHSKLLPVLNKPTFDKKMTNQEMNEDRVDLKTETDQDKDERQTKFNLVLQENIPKHHIVCTKEKKKDSIHIKNPIEQNLKKTKRMKYTNTVNAMQQDDGYEVHANSHIKKTNIAMVSSIRSTDNIDLIENNVLIKERENLTSDINYSEQYYEVEEIQEHVIDGQNVVQKIKYKCLRCYLLFDDLDSAALHYSNCQINKEKLSNELTINTSNCDVIFKYSEEEIENVEKISARKENEMISKVTNLVQLNAVENDSNMPTKLNCSRQLSLEERNNSANELAIRNMSMDNESELDEEKVMTHNNPVNEFKQRNKITAASRSKKCKTHKRKDQHTCPECSATFNSPSLLRRHSTVHTGERPYTCEICNRRFSLIEQLNFHRNFHKNPRHRCEICEKPFLRPSDIEKHMRTHTGEKPFNCNLCPKAFSQLAALHQHERTHTGDKPYTCEICGKGFSQKANMTKHFKIHKEGTKPHTCQICGRSFSDIKEMELHRAGHNGGRPRKCNHCSESFRKISELNHHIQRFHTFERPHKCKICSKAFYSMYNLKQHVLIHTGLKPYACSKCDHKFTQKGNLTKHFERKHLDLLVDNNKYIILDNKRYTENEVLVMDGSKEENLTSLLIVEHEETVPLREEI